MSPPPEGSILDRRTLNRTLLVRQYLLERVDAPAAAVVEHLVGMQAQVPIDPYLSLHARIRAFEPQQLEQLLLDRAAVRMTLMRTTLHLVTARDALRLRPVMQDVCVRAFTSSPYARRLVTLDLDEIASTGRSILESQPMTVAELGRKLAGRWPEHDPVSLAYAVRFLVPVVQVPPRGLFRTSSAPRMAPLETWLGSPSADLPHDGNPADSIVRYLRAFGPASVADIRTWSWLTGVRGVVDGIHPPLRRYRDEAGRELLDVQDGIFAAPEQPAPVRFVGEYDNVFLSHADRTRVTGDHAWGTAYARKRAFFVDGFLAGSWRLDVSGRDARIVLDPVIDLSPAQLHEVHAEAEVVAAFLA